MENVRKLYGSCTEVVRKMYGKLYGNYAEYCGNVDGTSMGHAKWDLHNRHGSHYVILRPWIAGSSTSLPIPQSPFVEINIYPNPVRDILSVSLSNNKECLYFDLYDISGRLIRHEQSSPDQTLVIFSIRWLSAGSYLLNIKTKDYGFNETYQLQKLR